MNRFAFDNASLLIPDISSYLALGYNAGLSSFVVQNVEGFNTSGYIVLEELGSKTWEILSINTINTSTNTITTNEASKFAHAFNKKVYYAQYNQVRLYRSINQTSTGSLIETKDIDGTNITNKGEKITVLEDSVYTTGYAFLTLYDSVGAIESNEFSSPIPYTIETDTAQYVIDGVYRQLRKQPDNVLTAELAFDLLNECTQSIRDTRRKFSDLNDLEDVIGNIEQGKWKYDLPTNIHSQLTNSSIYAIRLLGEKEMQWVDKMEWNTMTSGFIYSQLSAQIISGATTIPVVDGKVFETTGGELIIGSDAVSYTGVSGNTLTGVTGVTQTHAIDTYVFSGSVNKGVPRYYTVIDGDLFIYPLVDSVNAGKRLMIDYDKDVSPLINMNDVLPFPAMLYIPYLKSGFLETENYGEPTAGSANHKRDFQLKLFQFFKVDPRVKKSRFTTALYNTGRSRVRSSRIRRTNA
jgi:hypothetical protein